MKIAAVILGYFAGISVDTAPLWVIVAMLVCAFLVAMIPPRASEESS